MSVKMSIELQNFLQLVFLQRLVFLQKMQPRG